MSQKPDCLRPPRGFRIFAHCRVNGLDMLYIDLTVPTLKMARLILDMWGIGTGDLGYAPHGLVGNEWTITSLKTGRVYRGPIYRRTA